MRLPAFIWVRLGPFVTKLIGEIHCIDVRAQGLPDTSIAPTEETKAP